MSQVGFDTAWLNERFQFDNAARNQKVEHAFLYSFKEKKEITVVDIGSGTGANCLYFIEKIAKDQQWFFIEKDSRLVKPAFERLIEFAKKQDYDFQVEGTSLKIKTKSKTVNITILNDSFFELPQLVDLKKVDVVMAAAVFDLLSTDQFVKLAETIFSKEIALLATMNYSKMDFQPKQKLDKKFTTIYESHMNRQQPFGKGMGKKCAVFMEKYFLKKNYNFTKGSSPWKLGFDAFEMHNYLLNFMENSIGEMLRNPDEKAQFKQWLSEKRSLSQNQLLSINVEHFDFFVSKK
jgi:SAM-dependent methyltransferase